MNAHDVIRFPEPGRMGDCPKCKRNDGFLSIRKAHWFICKRHKFKWYAGYDLFPDWKQGTEEVWKRNADILSQYTEVRPIYRSPIKH